MDTQEPSQPASTTEQQQQFFQNLGQLASRFLQPLGLHVSVDPVEKEDEKEQSASAKVDIVHEYLLTAAEIVRLSFGGSCGSNLHTLHLLLMFISATFLLLFLS